MSILSRLEQYGARVGKLLAEFTGTWTFVFLYTASMLLWIGLHHSGALRFDTPDFVGWGMWAGYFAGIQASIVLMASNRDADADRKKHERDRRKHAKAFKIDEETHTMLKSLMAQITALEEIVESITHKGAGK